MTAADDGVTAAQARAGLHFADLFALDSRAGNNPELTLLSWVVSLPEGLDPAHIAGAVLGYQRDNPQRRLSVAVLALLEDVARFPAARLSRLAGQRRRRGRDATGADDSAPADPFCATASRRAIHGEEQ